ncbi:MAG: hypothetical protein ABI091_11045 [Ferruginibacter sp.]
MKRLVSFFAAIIIFEVLFSSCSKENNTVTVNPPQVAKWMLDKEYNHGFVNGQEYWDTAYGGANDYMDFKSNNTIFKHTIGDTSTLFYEMSGTDKFIWWQPTTIKFTANILKLTNSEFIIYQGYKNAYGSITSDETIFLKK